MNAPGYADFSRTHREAVPNRAHNFSTAALVSLYGGRFVSRRFRAHHGGFSKNPHNQEHSFSINLSLPTGTLHATGVGGNIRAACKKAFAELEVQVKKHQSRLRKDYEWKRKRLR